MKVYIAGKISGDSTYREKFQRAQKALEGEGFIVLNPAELPEGMLASDYDNARPCNLYGQRRPLYG